LPCRHRPGHPTAGLPKLTCHGLLWGLLISALTWIPRPALSADARQLDPPSAAAVINSAPSLSVGQGQALLAQQPIASSKGAAFAGVPILEGVIVVRLDPTASAGDPSSKPDHGDAAAAAGVVATAAWRDGPPEAPLGDLRLVFLAPGRDAVEEASRWSTRPDVAWAEPYRIAHLARVPDDPLLPLQAHLGVVRAFDAWDLVRGEERPWPVAVVDGGIDIDHADLAANVLVNLGDPLNGIDDDGNGYVDDNRGWNFATGSDDPGALGDELPMAVRHGTHVAGIISAVTDNGAAVAGLTWNDPVLCIAANHATVDNNIIFGYQGILYAAERGVRVINCSWGRPGNASLLEMAVLEHVFSLGAVVIAAAGNEGNDEPFYPAAYPGVFAVANVLNDGARLGSSNYGLWVDAAAPGVGIYSLYPGGQVGPLTGTSMASPVVAGAAALLWGLEPRLSGAALLQKLRITAHSLDEVNPAEAGLLGCGLVDAAAALIYQGPGYAPEQVEIVDEDGDGLLEPGESVLLRPVWWNRLADGDEQVRIRMDVAGAPVDILAGEAILPPLPHDGRATADHSFRLHIDPEVASGSNLTLIWQLEGINGVFSSYRDRHITEFVIAPLFADLAEGEIRLSLGGNGRIGFTGLGGGNGRDGLGVRYVPAGQTQGDGAVGNLLFEGALMLGDDPQRISDAARRYALGGFDADFLPDGRDGTPRSLPEVQLADGTTLARIGAGFRDEGATYPLGLRVVWEALVPPDADLPGLAWILVNVTNGGEEHLTNLHLGFFLDWDLNGGGYFPSFRENSTLHAPEEDFARVFRSDQPLGKTVATALVCEPGASPHFRAINNDNADPQNPSWGIYDGFSDDEKWEALSVPDGPQEALVADISQIWATGPCDLAAGESLRCVLVLAAGGTSAEAAIHATRGIEVAGSLLMEQNWSPPPLPFTVGQPSPNPWNGAVSVPVTGSVGQAWHLRVYDLRGRLIYVSGPVLASTGGRIGWDGRDAVGLPVASGTYLLRIGQGDRDVTRKICLVR
jgi:serine protease